LTANLNMNPLAHKLRWISVVSGSWFQWAWWLIGLMRNVLD